MQATGEFEVTMRPLETYAASDASPPLGRFSLDKRFAGDLDATSQGEMLSAMTAVEGSAGYVALERVTGVLNGRRGAFVLQHFGVMHAGDSRLVLEVVPDSGTDELATLAGSMTIRVADGRHFYELDYSLD